MRPVPSSTAFFAADQQWLFRVRSWDTPQTVIENDLSSDGMRLRVYQPILETTDWAAYAKAVQAVAGGSSPETAFTSSTYAVASVANGRWPLVQSYWGSGTPNWWGGARTGRVALSFKGTLVPAAQRAWLSSSSSFTFALAGSGWARIDVVEGATRTTVFKGDLTETLYLTNGFSLSSTKTLAAGAVLEVYYIQTLNNPWGGLVVKAIPGARPADSDIQDAAAAAPVLSAGLFSYGAAVEPVELPFIMSVNVSQEVGSASRAEIEIPLLNPDIHDGNGWMFYQLDQASDPGVLQVWEGGEQIYTLKRKRLIQIQVARREETPEWTPIFTGHVDDFGSGSNGKLTIYAVSFEGRMVEQYEQAPDRISYMANGFRVLDYSQSGVSRTEPVYNVPAFDAWPLAWAIQELGTRAGIDPSCYRKEWAVVLPDGAGIVPEVPWGTPQLFRATAFNGDPVRLPRPVHYGNVGLSFTENRPYDDEYVFKVEPTKDLWARARELADRLGYVCRFDAAGAAVLYPASSPTFVRDLGTADVTNGTATLITNPAGYGAKYLQVANGQAATIEVRVKASRIDISFPRVLGARNWLVSIAPTGQYVRVTQDGATRVTQSSDRRIINMEMPSTTNVQVTPGSTSSTPDLFFNALVYTPSANSTVFKAYSGEYDEYVVTLTTNGTSGIALLDCLICYSQDPDLPILPALSTSDAADTVVTRAQQDLVRNKVTVVGRRKGAVTDSDKFAEAQAPTEQEFVVQNAVDVKSITDPSAANYVGYLKQAMIYDSSISDDGLARYLAQVFIYRQSVPKFGATVEHTMLPMLELGDPVAVEETRFDTTTGEMTQYVSKITHTINQNKLRTRVETEAWPNYPAYQPRTDINLADFDNKPVTDLAVAYTSISGHSMVNPSLDDIKEVRGTWIEQNNVGISGSTLSLSSSLPWPPVPGTFQIKPNYNADTSAANKTAMVYINGPWTAGTRVGTIALADDWSLKKVTVALSNLGFESASADLTWTYTVPPAYESRSGPFYYDLGNGYVSVYRGTGDINIKNPTIMGAVKIEYSVSTADTRLGWLTNTPYHKFVNIDYSNNASSKVTLSWTQAPGLEFDTRITSFNVRYRSLFESNNRVDPNGGTGGVWKSPFYDPYTSELGNLVSFSCAVLADGLYRVSVRNWDDDTVVAWLTNPAGDPLKDEQHWEYLPIQAGKTFTWDGVDQIGEWNGTQSGLYSELVEGTFEYGKKPRVGRGFYCWNRELGNSDMGPQAYIWMKQNADGTPIIGHGRYARWYINIEAETTTEADTLVSTKGKEFRLFSDPSEPNIAILTHLPEPTKLELQISDNTGSGWTNPITSTPSSTVPFQYIHNEKPLRIWFKVAPRPGALWDGNQDEVSVKLTREVHLRAIIGDQTVVYSGKEFSGSQVEERTIYNRRLVNDEHTKQYTDTGYRKAKTLKNSTNTSTEAVTEWVFYPKDFKSDFRINGYDESIEFGNYLQLEEVPSWNGARAVTASRSRLHFALMSYLFYLSAYVTDRSGRSSWGINRSFIDKSKIYNNATELTWPIDPMYEQRRTIVCRQWTQEPGWSSAQLSKFGYHESSLFAKMLAAFWHQYDIRSSSLGVTANGTTPSAWSSFNLSDDQYSNWHTGSSTYRLPTPYLQSRQLGRYDTGVPVCDLAKRSDGQTAASDPRQWTWELSPVWVPSITRDLHPYFLLPPMISPPLRTGAEPRPGIERNYAAINCYLEVTGFETTVEARANTTSTSTSKVHPTDAAAAETWSSIVFDFTHTNNAAKRFWPGTHVDIKEDPLKGSTYNGTVPTNALNYVRQDEMVHWEDLRGIYSRGKYPAAQAIKVSPVAPYYLNLFRYNLGIEVGYTVNDSPYPVYHEIVPKWPNDTPDNSALPASEWFRVGFRGEYVWESGSMFPTTRTGIERLDGVLWWKTGYLPRANNLFYDYGAWTGWKDDLIGGTPRVIGGRRVGGNYIQSDITVGNPFTTGAMPVGVGPVLPQTTEVVSHLVLVPERRGS